MEGRVSWGEEGAPKLVRQIEKWRETGATHVSINTMNAGLGAVDAHLAALTQVADALGLRA